MTPRLSLCLLGPLDVRLGTTAGEPMSGLRYNKMRALLAYLAVESGQPHARSHLCGLLWPDSSEPAARQSLSQALTRLRRAFGPSNGQSPFLLTTTESIQLNPAADIDVDVSRFETLIRACEAHASVHRGWHLCTPCAERLEQAVALYHGDFLTEFFLDDCAPFEEWALVVRERLRQHMLSALERRARYAEWHGAYEQAAHYLRRQVDLEPWLESNQRSLMRQLALSGQTTAALTQYEHLRRALARELGAEPEAETVALYQHIKEGTLPAPPDSRHPASQLPAPPTRLIGREAEVAATLARLRQDDVRALTLTGAPGIGKTRLALELAHRLRFDFQEGAYWIDLAPLTQAAQVAAGVARALGIREQAGKPWSATLAAALKHSHLLIVLDNFEHVQEAALFLAELLAACPALKVIVTSRTPLGIRAERQYTLTPLTLPPAGAPPDVVAASPAVQLFVERAQAVWSGFQLTVEQSEAVAALCARLDGLPLAIELIAARVHSHPPAALLAELGRGLTALGPNWRDLPERQRTLTSALRWSLNLLSTEQQRVFAHLGVFVDGFTAAGLEAVISAPSPEVPWVTPALEALQQASLVQVHPVEGERRFSLLEMTRAFALEQLLAQGLAEAARAAHANYYCVLVEQAQPELTGPDQVAWFRRLDRELANLRAALAWSQANARELNVRLAVALGSFWIGHGHMSEGRQWLKEALPDEGDAAGDLALERRAKARMMAGRLAWKQGDFREAQRLLTESRTLWQQTADQAGLAFTLFNLGVAVERQGDYATGQTYLEESLQLARGVGETYTAACALGALAEVANRQGDMARDRQYLEQALALHLARRDPRMTAATLMNLGTANVDTGEFEVGQRHIQASLAVARELDDPHFTADCLLNLGDVLVAQGRPAEARAYLEEAIGIYRATHSAASADAALATLGQALEKLGDLAGAHARQADALRLRAEAGDQYYVAVSLTHQARVLWREKSAERAAQLLGAADAIHAAIGASLRPSLRAEYDQLVAGLQADLGEAAYRRAWEAGRRLSQEEAVAMGTE